MLFAILALIVSAFLVQPHTHVPVPPATVFSSNFLMFPYHKTVKCVVQLTSFMHYRGYNILYPLTKKILCFAIHSNV